jgi:tetratricopeptide (TPR) repeat protein
MTLVKVLLAGFILLSSPVWAASDPSTFRQANELLNGWNLSKAESLINSLSEEYSDSEELALLKSRLDFFKGNYESAWKYIEPIKTNDPSVESLRYLIDQTRQTAGSFVSKESEHFIFRFEDGSDEILIHHAKDALEKSYEVLGKILNFYPDQKVIVEFYPSREPFSKVSPLTLKDIMTSGTVALCKYNRLMAISPGSLLRGYNWLDTLSHEYVHYLLTQKSGNKVPLWLHEGLAKFLETRWRGTKEPLTPLMETVLAKGLKEDYLIGLDQMMPSLAKLKTAEDVQLAYAEVASMVEYMVEQKGETVVSFIVEDLRDDLSITKTLQKRFGQTLKDFQGSWKKYAQKKKFKIIPGITALRFNFKKDRKQSEKDKKQEYAEIQSKQARDLTFLGDVLKSRSFIKAAIVEYQKAIEKTKSLSPVLHNKLAQTFMLKKEYEKAEPLLKENLKYYPSFHTTLVNLGELHFQKDAKEKSRVYFEKAFKINPFNPFVHSRLISIYKTLGLDKEKELQVRLFRYLE